MNDATPIPTPPSHEAMLHEPNATAWKAGDLVIHDADAKRPDMLMIVLGCSRAGVYRTRYAFPAKQPKSWRRKVWRNSIEALHDPRRFGIALRDNPAAALTIAAVRAAIPALET